MGRIHKFTGTLVPPLGKNRPRRIILFILLVLTLIWAYSRHFDRRLEEINASSEIIDPQNIISKEEKEHLRENIYLLRKNYGVRARIDLGNKDMSNTAHEANTRTSALPNDLLVLAGYDGNQENKQDNEQIRWNSVIILPQLMRLALPVEYEILYAEKLSACLNIIPAGICLEQFFTELQTDLQNTR